ncbi:DUF6241 domain-containing protein [Paucisalibacillus sp. EB02]|uniref:DUF6241 domain-containing protein n=1 Tax=Paucisalibacillus sp. EB02 TaxID=1347087 RepID=UPI000693D943|nr:DUF6241 domain-containing protein [Paucisalibacillus sp. EB02]
MSKKILLPISIIGSIILVGFIGWSFYQEIGTGSEDASLTEDVINEKTDSKSKTDVREGVNPFGDVVSKNGLTRKIVLEYIHYMSHQKVDAYAKWGFFEMTEERINWLHDAVSKNNNKIGLTKAELAIIDRWAEGDFTNIVYDHNLVHKEASSERVAVDGGVATGVLSSEEEQAYIENTTEMDEIRN